jgi:ankyrin repeat protein
MDDLRSALAVEGAVNSHAYDGWTPLHLSAFFGHAEAARLLLESGASINAVSTNNLRNTPLHAAVAARRTEVAILLLEHGADPYAIDGGGYTAEAIARENGMEPVIEAIRRNRG